MFNFASFKYGQNKPAVTIYIKIEPTVSTVTELNKCVNNNATPK